MRTWESTARATVKNPQRRACLIICAVLLVVAHAVVNRNGGVWESYKSSWGDRQPARGVAANDPALQSCVRTMQSNEDQASADGGAGLPADFDWEAYFYWRPDLKQKGIDTKEEVEEHYLTKGRRKGLLYKRYCMIMVYDTEGGLINQVYSHVAAIMLAKAMGAELVLTPAIHRDSFNSHMTKTTWHAAPQESLLDVDAVKHHWRRKGLLIHTVAEPTLLNVDDELDTLQLLNDEPPLDMRSRVRVQLGNHKHVKRTFKETVETIRKAIQQQTQALLRADPRPDLPYLVVHLSSPFWSSHSLENEEEEEALEAARSLLFARPMLDLADQVMRNMTGSGRRVHNGLHLRIEGDAMAHGFVRGGKGGIKAVMNQYFEAMREAGFDSKTPIYMASGLLTYGDEEGMEKSIRKIVKAGVASEVHYKEEYLSSNALAGLHSEQQALVDFLVLTRCRAFVGFGVSSFSFYLPQYKAMHGFPVASSVLLGGITEEYEMFGRIMPVEQPKKPWALQDLPYWVDWFAPK